ncbi:unnamed protein product, partial [Effrenium voratum]
PFVLRSFFLTARIRVGLGLVMSRHDQGHWSWSGNKYRSASGALNQLKKKTQKAEEEHKQEKEESEKVLHSFAAANALLKQRETELLSENSQLKVQAAQLQDTVQHLKARRQEYSAKIALMTAKLQDTDGKLDLSTELARERKAQIADLQRQNKDWEKKLKDAQQRAARAELQIVGMEEPKQRSKKAKAE